MSDEGVYRERARLIAFLATCYPAVMTEDDGAEWPVIFVRTPFGQMSWHIARSDLDLFGHVPSGDGAEFWDGHSADEKYERLRRLVDFKAAAHKVVVNTAAQQLAEAS